MEYKNKLSIDSKEIILFLILIANIVARQRIKVNTIQLNEFQFLDSSLGHCRGVPGLAMGGPNLGAILSLHR